MARTQRPARPRKEPDYAHVGVKGRRTGLELRDPGIRDAAGFDPIDIVLSPPTAKKATPQPNGHGNVTLTEDEMELDPSYTRGPEELLSARSTKSSWMPPPRSRSPLKTSLGSSPRRSFVHAPSPLAQRVFGDTQSPARSTSARSSVRAPSRHSSSSAAPEQTSSPSKIQRQTTNTTQRQSAAGSSARRDRTQRRQTFDLPADEDEEMEQSMQDAVLDTRARAEASSRTPIAAQDDSLPPIVDYDEPLPGAFDDEPQAPSSGESEPDALSSPAGSLNVRTASARRQSRIGAQPAARSVTSSPRATRDSYPSPSPIATSHEDESIALNEESMESVRESTQLPSQSPQSIAHSPAKPRKPQAQQPRKRRKKDNGHQQDASQPKSQSRAALKAVRRPQTHNAYVLRSETPEEVAQYTRSGRPSVKPLAYWRNEKVIYGGIRKEGSRLSLPGMQKVERFEEMPPPPARKGRKRPASKRKQDPDLLPEDDDNDEDMEEWEADPGMLEGPVLIWDPESQRGDDMHQEHMEIAMAPHGLAEVTREVKDQGFLFAKTISLPFFHSGMVDIPPGGEKRVKNSKWNHMVFWVFAGRVEVKVGENHFSIGRGGMWQVPRGNFYSLQNAHDQKVRIFFAQGCDLSQTPADLDESGPYAGRPSNGTPAPVTE